MTLETICTLSEITQRAELRFWDITTRSIVRGLRLGSGYLDI